eukprot:116030-Amphidinium_carterae.1
MSCLSVCALNCALFAGKEFRAFFLEDCYKAKFRQKQQAQQHPRLDKMSHSNVTAHFEVSDSSACHCLNVGCRSCCDVLIRPCHALKDPNRCTTGLGMSSLPHLHSLCSTQRFFQLCLRLLLAFEQTPAKRPRE